MASRYQLIAAAILVFSATVLSNPLARRDSSNCPASCLMTTTVTVVSTAESTATASVVTTVPVDSSILIVQTSSDQTTISGPVQSSVATGTTPQKCSHNNCLRQFLRHPQVTAFCATYTTTINTATTNLPSYVTQCHAEPSRISSACSCIVIGVVQVTSVITSNTAPVASSVSNTEQETLTDDGTFTTLNSYSNTANPAPTSTLDDGMCMASIIYETYTQTTTYLVTLTGSSSMSRGNATDLSMLTSSSVLISDANFATASATSSSIA
ncbi:hypothetical protein EG329_013774 [Mollisiaceae sp. DMI_Dod_QoI]|nr:hypothetical protein EG329_013774 [Helotiales sp. DMI_Dod_QoI]